MKNFRLISLIRTLKNRLLKKRMYLLIKDLPNCSFDKKYAVVFPKLSIDHLKGHKYDLVFYTSDKYEKNSLLQQIPIIHENDFNESIDIWDIYYSYHIKSPLLFIKYDKQEFPILLHIESDGSYKLNVTYELDHYENIKKEKFYAISLLHGLKTFADSLIFSFNQAS